MQKSRDTLPAGTVIDCYSVIKMIGSGGFSLIYLAEDEDTQDQVVIKEYLPKKLAYRDEMLNVRVSNPEKKDAFNNGRKLFYQEAKALAMLRHPNIVNVRTFFLAHNTAYLVMDYEHGKNLGTYIKQRKGGLSAKFLLTVFPEVLDALNLIHSEGHLHLDIKPSNIHLRPGGSPLLLDFGAVHQFATTRSSQTSQVVTPGFAPVEQYYSSGYVGPWSDVYAIGATMRACIEGQPPPSAIERHAKDTLKPIATLQRRRYPAYLLELIDWAMEVDPLLRPQNAHAMLEALRHERGRPAEIGQQVTIDDDNEKIKLEDRR
ncbi:MAG: serine/threonine protein kinase [Chromatiales bacterium]|nr:serine/threonine protein kinase [Chromatiales bacterium]